MWWLYHKTKEPRIFETEQEYLSALESGEWKDTPAAFDNVEEDQVDVETKVYSKHQLGRMNSEKRRAILGNYGVVASLEMSRDEEIKTILNFQGEK
jgi:hypothetical protein